jgi:hypothetical protein
LGRQVVPLNSSGSGKRTAPADWAWDASYFETVEPRQGRELPFGSGKGSYSGWSKSMDEAGKLKKPWTLHDLRRTGRTGLGILGVAPHIAEAVLNHLPPKPMRTYDKNKYEKEKRATLDLWAAHLTRLVSGEKGNMVPLRAPSSG